MPNTSCKMMTVDVNSLKTVVSKVYVSTTDLKDGLHEIVPYKLLHGF